MTWSMMCAGLIVGLPVFFEVGFVLLIPIAFTVARRTRTSLILVGLPLVAGLSVVHALVPPHPAAMLAVTIFHADVGRTILYALLVGIPSAVDCRAALRPVHRSPDCARRTQSHGGTVCRAGCESLVAWLCHLDRHCFVAGVADAAWQLGGRAGIAGHPAKCALHLLGSADIALLVAVLISFVTLGKMRGFNRETILKFSNECLAPTAHITLVIGAGGGFGRILQDSGVSQAIVAVALHAHVSLLLLGWLVAALIRLATGSATVALTTAAGILAPILAHSPGRTAGIAGHRHRRRIGHLLPCQRWRLLAGEGVFQHERSRYHEDLVHQRNHNVDQSHCC